MVDNRTLHSERLTGADRSYFIDLKRNGHARAYLSVSMLDQQGDRQRILVDESKICAFAKALTEMADRYRSVEAELREERIRVKYPNEGKPWTPDDEARLAAATEQRLRIGQIAKELGRMPSSVRAKLKQKQTAATC